MQTNRLGRALGIGVRLATQRILPPPPPPRAPARDPAGVRLGRGARNFGQGGRALGRAVWDPFAHAGSILWLEITGMFFLLFALLFAQHLWALRGSYRTGPEHTHFLVYGACTVVFLWFAGSSFARAARRRRRRSR